jgi:uncharacterized low-complexity protein
MSRFRPEIHTRVLAWITKQQSGDRKIMSNESKLAAILGAALASTLGAVGVANAGEGDVFAMQELNSGYLTAGGHEEGGCGDDKDDGEGSCGDDKDDGEGSCGEGKCGGDS